MEVYGGVTNHAHAPPTTVSGRSGHVDPAHPQLVDPALLTSLDLESDHAAPAHEMLVTDAPHSTRPHDLNHNNHAFGHKSSGEWAAGGVAASQGLFCFYCSWSSNYCCYFLCVAPD